MEIDSEWDVVVVGGGPAGFTAAVASARNGARTLLIERYGVLGGMATVGGVGPFMTFFDAKGEQVVKGIPEELIERLIEAKGAVGHLIAKPSDPMPSNFVPFDPEVLKYVTYRMVEEAGANLLFHSLFVDTIAKENSLKGIVIENKSGRQIILSRVVIDATGDGDVAARAGAPYEVGRKTDGLTQPPSLLFKLTNVNIKTFIAYAKEHPEDFLSPPVFPKCDRPIPEDEGFTEQHMQGEFSKGVKEAIKKGELYLGKDHINIYTDLWEGQVIINATRILKVDSLNPRDLTFSEMEGRRQMLSVVNFLRKNVPGFESSRVLQTGTHIGIRESRRILGEYVLTEKDVIEARKFEDGVAKGAFSLDVHDPTSLGHPYETLEKMGIPKGGGYYEVPYRCLVPKKVENLLIAGRCISGTHLAHSSYRIMPTCMAIGEAAGTAAALAVQSNVPPRKIDVKLLRKKLIEQGAL